MTREELIKRIALKMDEISSSDDVIVPVGTSDNNPLYAQINNLLNESVNEVLMKAPLHRLYSQTAVAKSSIPSYSESPQRRIATISLPDDFLRFVSISDSLFQRPIVELATEGDIIASRQYNKHLVAKNAKPVAVLMAKNNHRQIVCYSYSQTETPNPSLYYIKRYDNDRDTASETDLDEYMIDIVSWVCAGKVFASQGDNTRGKICDENAASLMV